MSDDDLDRELTGLEPAQLARLMFKAAVRAADEATAMRGELDMMRTEILSAMQMLQAHQASATAQGIREVLQDRDAVEHFWAGLWARARDGGERSVGRWVLGALRGGLARWAFTIVAVYWALKIGGIDLAERVWHQLSAAEKGAP